MINRCQHATTREVQFPFSPLCFVLFLFPVSNVKVLFRIHFGVNEKRENSKDYIVSSLQEGSLANMDIKIHFKHVLEKK